MKNILKFLGVITCIAVIGFSMTGCPEEEPEPEVGTIEVTNDSRMHYDINETGVKVELKQGTTVIDKFEGLQTTSATGDADNNSSTADTNLNWTKNPAKAKAIFKDVPAGDYDIVVTDSKPIITTQKITLAKGETLVFSYTGEAVVKK